MAVPSIPCPFLQPDDPAPPAPRTNPERLRERVRVRGSRVALREGPAPGAAARARLDAATVARIEGVSQAAVRLRLPDGTIGYVDASAVVPAAAPLRRARLTQGVALREGPAARSPIVTTVTTVVQAEVLGEFAGYELVRVPDGGEGWIEAAAR